MRSKQFLAGLIGTLFAGSAMAGAYSGDSTGFSGNIGATPAAVLQPFFGANNPTSCSWQNVTAQRLMQSYTSCRGGFSRHHYVWICTGLQGPTYTNTTGKTIYVTVSPPYAAALTSYVNYQAIGGGGTFMVGPGDEYSVFYSGNIPATTRPQPEQANSWLECR